MTDIPTLYLTKAERAVFEKLPENVRSGVKVEEETLTFEDTEEKMASRMRTLELSHPALRKLQEEAKTRKFSEKEAIELAKTVDLSQIPKEDLMQLAFAWGPNVFSAIIAGTLNEGVFEKEEFFHLVFIRHGLLMAMNQ